MARMPTVNPAEATGETKELLDKVKAKVGRVPNIVATMANSPAALKCYLGLSGALADGALPPQLREQLALAIGEVNGCHYCIAAHTVIGKMAGLDDEAILGARKGTASDPKAKAAIEFALAVNNTKGFVSDEQLGAVRDAGYSDGEIAELVAVAALNIYTNSFNHVADTDVDFPAAPEL